MIDFQNGIGRDRKVTVLMAAYNSAEFIAEAIRSILEQTFTDFTFLIINDASTDRTEDVILSFDDSRIVYLKNTLNLGVGHTAHLGMKMIQSKYVVRFDSDDISFPNRIESLVNFMEENPEIPIASSYYEIFWNGSGVNNVYETSLQLRTRALFECPVSQYIIIDNYFLKQHDINYNPNLRVAEDYDLYLKVLRIAEIAKVPEVLVKYRKHKTSLTSKEYKLQDELSTKLRLGLLKGLTGLCLEREEIEVYKCYSFHRTLVKASHLYLLKKVLRKIRYAYYRQDTFKIDKGYYLKIEYQKLQVFLIENKSLGFPILFAYLITFGLDFRIFLGLGLFLRVMKFKGNRIWEHLVQK